MALGSLWGELQPLVVEQEAPAEAAAYFLKSESKAERARCRSCWAPPIPGGVPAVSPNAKNSQKFAFSLSGHHSA
jgi:hypothetical protein